MARPPRHAQIRSALRKIWLWSPERREAKTRARVSRGVYQCEQCHRQTGPKGVDVDHWHEPPGATPGSRNAKLEDTWDEFIRKLFCPTENLVVLCKICHREKTKKESQARRRQ